MKTTPSKFFPFNRLCLVLVGIACLFAGGPRTRAQDAGVGGLKVGTITVKFVGTANVNEQVVRANMETKAGGDLDESVLDRDIRALYKTGLFEYIEFKREEVDGRTVNLVVEVTPKYRVLAVRIEGNKRVKTKRLEKEIKTSANTALDERQVKEDSGKIRDYYQKEGYNQVTVSYTIDRDRTTGLGTVIFKVREGNKVRIKDIRFTGNAHMKASKLRKQMETKRWWIFSWLTDTGRLIDDTFQDDLDKLRDFYREQGYLDVDISEDKVLFDYPNPERLIITINIDEGRRYKVGAISFSGNKLHSSSLLTRVVALYAKTGRVFSPTLIDKAAERVEDYYGQDGYLDTRVTVVRTPNLASNDIDVEFKVDESQKFFVESVGVEGNVKTKSLVIIRELAIGPGDVFNTVRMKVSKLRLQNTRFFDDVTTTPEETNIPGHRNLRVAVKEARTGSLTFGAGYSTLERASVFAEYQQTNFDLFNPHSMFQGAGQKLDLKVSVGQLSSQDILNFEEPWLFQKQLALGTSLYDQTSDYVSSFYDEVDLGGQVYLRKRLFGLIDGTLTYGYQVTEIKSVSPSASPEIQAFAGDHDISKTSIQILRDTRDNLLNTTSGNRIELDAAVAGGIFGGTDNFYSLEFRGSQFFKVFDQQSQILSIIARGGVIDNYGKTATLPFYDAWYLGGPYDLRGFEYHQVSPRDLFGEPIGGKTYGLLSTEYTVDIVDPVRIAAFYDWGFVNVDAYDFNPSLYNDDFGIGLRLSIAGAPLRLDYAIPLKGDKSNRQGNQFNFSFGTRF